MTDADAHRAPPPRSRIAGSLGHLGRGITVLVSSLVALFLRFVAARVFFLSGQLKIAGPAVAIPLPFQDGTFSVVLPAALKPATFDLFDTQFADLPMPPLLAAYVFTYAEFLLPVCLVLGFATRLAASALLIMTVLIQIYVAPDALWTAHVYLAAILLVLITAGPGVLSLDALLRAVWRR